MARTRSRRLVVCVDNEGYPAALERRQIYRALPDPRAEKLGLLRVIDESGQDYLYPRSLFRPFALPLSVRKAVLAAFEYRLEHDTRFLRRIDKARKSLRAGRGVRLEDVK